MPEKKVLAKYVKGAYTETRHEYSLSIGLYKRCFRELFLHLFFYSGAAG